MIETACLFRKTRRKSSITLVNLENVLKPFIEPRAHDQRQECLKSQSNDTFLGCGPWRGTCLLRLLLCGTCQLRFGISNLNFALCKRSRRPCFRVVFGTLEGNSLLFCFIWPGWQVYLVLLAIIGFATNRHAAECDRRKAEHLAIFLRGLAGWWQICSCWDKLLGAWQTRVRHRTCVTIKHSKWRRWLISLDGRVVRSFRSFIRQLVWCLTRGHYVDVLWPADHIKFY